MVNQKAFFLVRWQLAEGEEKVLVGQFHTIHYLHSLGVIPPDAQVVEAAHPEALRFDGVFYGGNRFNMAELAELADPKPKEWGLFDHTNTLVEKVEALDSETATEKLEAKIPGRAGFPPMWRVLELELAGV